MMIGMSNGRTVQYIELAGSTFQNIGILPTTAHAAVLLISHMQSGGKEVSYDQIQKQVE